jgi:hypothetical protein
MNVILHQHPGITGGRAFAEELSETGEETLVVLCISEDGGPFNSPDDDMVNSNPVRRYGSFLA